MSDIPHARALLLEARAHIAEAQRLIDEGLALLNRRKPTFRSPRSIKGLSLAQKRRAIALRAKGHSVWDIAKRLKTNHGRISEAVSGKAH